MVQRWSNKIALPMEIYRHCIRLLKSLVPQMFITISETSDEVAKQKCF